MALFSLYLTRQCGGQGATTRPGRQDLRDSQAPRTQDAAADADNDNPAYTSRKTAPRQSPGWAVAVAKRVWRLAASAAQCGSAHTLLGADGLCLFLVLIDVRGLSRNTKKGRHSFI